MSDSSTDAPIEEVIVTRIQADLSPAEVQLRDMTGTRDHWEAVIVSPQFEGVRLIARQQRVYRALGALMTGPIHAFTMMTLTPQEAHERGIVLKNQPTESQSETDETGDVKRAEKSSSGLVSLN